MYLELFLGNSGPILLFLLDYLHDDESRRKRFRLFRLLRDNRMHEFDLHHVRLISFSDFPDSVENESFWSEFDVRLGASFHLDGQQDVVLSLCPNARCLSRGFALICHGRTSFEEELIKLDKVKTIFNTENNLNDRE